jgi:3-methyladenine DNA glycosylase AlkD
MTADEVVAELKTMGNENIKRILMRHGAKEPFFGVKIEDLKKIQKRIKQDYQLALDLYDTGISDAMYLAGLIADDQKMTKKDLEKWAKKAHWGMLCDYTVPWVAAGSKHGWELALKWIDSPEEKLERMGWATVSSIISVRPDEELDLPTLKRLLARVVKTIHDRPDLVRYVMNGFVIALGCFVAPLHADAVAAAKKIGKVEVDMGDTACQVPFAPDYIAKVKARRTIGKKRKSAKC